MKIINVLHNIRYLLIALLAGDMPVVLNMVVARPRGHDDALVYLPHADKPGMVCRCTFLSESRPYVMAPARDVEGSGELVRNYALDWVYWLILVTALWVFFGG